MQITKFICIMSKILILAIYLLIWTMVNISIFFIKKILKLYLKLKITKKLLVKL